MGKAPSMVISKYDCEFWAGYGKQRPGLFTNRIWDVLGVAQKEASNSKSQDLGEKWRRTRGKS